MVLDTTTNILARPSGILEEGGENIGIDVRRCLNCAASLTGPADRIHSFCDWECFGEYFEGLPATSATVDPWKNFLISYGAGYAIFTPYKSFIYAPVAFETT